MKITGIKRRPLNLKTLVGFSIAIAIILFLSYKVLKG